MHSHDLILLSLGFFSEVLGTLSGFGSSTFFVPAAVLFERFQFVLALTALLHCFGNFFRILIFRRSFDLKTFILLVVPSVAFTAVGALVLTLFPPHRIELPLGLVLMAVGLLCFFKNGTRKLLPKWIAWSLSGASGFLTGYVGTGGAIRGVALTALNLEKNTFIVVSSAVDMGGDFLRTVIYIANGFMDWNQWFYLPILGLAAFTGTKAGKFLLNYINQGQFEKMVAVSIIASGFLMVMGEPFVRP